MHKFIRKWLGIEWQAHRIEELAYRIQVLKSTMRDMDKENKVLLQQILSGRKPDDLSPETRAESDRIGREVMDHLLAEHKARMHTTGEDYGS